MPCTQSTNPCNKSRRRTGWSTAEGGQDPSGMHCGAREQSAQKCRKRHSVQPERALSDQMWNNLSNNNNNNKHRKKQKKEEEEGEEEKKMYREAMPVEVP